MRERTHPPRTWALCAVAFGLGAAALADEGHQHAAGEKLGQVDFAVSCSPPAQRAFTRGVALLHSFGYEEAEKTFREAAAADPSCAMAWWGVGMSLFHPVWAAGNPAAAPTPAELARGREAAERAGAAGAKTQREADYVAALQAFYRDSERLGYPDCAAAFEKGMEAVARRYPEDQEAQVFYALALLGTAPPSDKTYAGQKKAAAILNRVLPRAPEHPGVAHYLIHSLDYPPLASLALDAARAYAKIAPSSPHALHMPSHIFTRLGRWDESIRSNLDSSSSAREHLARAHPGMTSFDELHALDYLAYAYLQQAQDTKARAVVDQVAKVASVDNPQFAAAYALAAVPARYVLERRQWKEAAGLSPRPESFPWARFPYAVAITHFARALGGARAGDLALARDALGRLEAIHDELAQGKDPYWAAQVEIQRQASAAWIARAEGRSEDAVRRMRLAAELEDTTEKHPVTPGAVLPARELLGDLLLDLGRPREAMAEYDAVLQVAPGRFNSVYGAGRAAELAGEREKARARYGELDSLCAHGDGSRPELASARARLAGND
jgi:hypothetical protein